MSEIPTWLKNLGLLGLLNFGVFVLIGHFYLGGFSTSTPSQGVYYLEKAGRGKVQVSREVYLYSLWHGRFTLAFVFGFLGVAGVYGWRSRRKI